MAVVIILPGLPNGYKILYGSFLYTGITISYKHQLMHTYIIINTTLLALCYSNMFQPSKGHPQGARLIHFHSKLNQIWGGNQK